jgi:acylphosphatase
MIKHLSITVMGHVQGVFFRASTVEKAKELGLLGQVRNLHDGSVLIEVEGDESVLQTFVKWAHVGPPRARVERCIVEEGPPANFSDFKIIR